MRQKLVGDGLIDAIWKCWSHKRSLSENWCIWERQMFSWLVTGVWSSVSLRRYALARYRYRIWNSSSTDMPWLDTGIESGISRQQICPGWIQESNLEIVVNRYALSGYRNWIWKIVVNRYTLARYRNRIFELFRRALAGYRNRVWNSRHQIHPGEIQESDLRTLQTCPGRIQESSLGYSRQQIHPGKIHESDLRTLQTCPGMIQESSLEM